MKEHVTLRRRSQQRGKPRRRLQVQNDSELAPVHPKKRARFPGESRRILAQIIALGRLDFNNLRAKIRQQRTAIRAGNIRTQIQYPDSGKWSRKLNRARNNHQSP